MTSTTRYAALSAATGGAKASGRAVRTPLARYPATSRGRAFLRWSCRHCRADRLLRRASAPGLSIWRKSFGNWLKSVSEPSPLWRCDPELNSFRGDMQKPPICQPADLAPLQSEGETLLQTLAG